MIISAERREQYCENCCLWEAEKQLLLKQIVTSKLQYEQLDTDLPEEEINRYMLLIKIAVAQNEVALSYHRVRGLYFLAVIFAANIDIVSKREA